MPPSPALWAYFLVTAGFPGLGRRQLRRRLAQGKEHPERHPERLGTPSEKRPDGRLVWFHAASVGESLSLLELIRRLLEDEPDLTVLVTTGTVTSAELLSGRLPPRAIHQFIPLDFRPFVRQFLDHWRPDLAIWTESEFWPNLLILTHARGVPMLLLNARMSMRSARRWGRYLPWAVRRLVTLFTAVQAQDRATGASLVRLGLSTGRLSVTGTLKEDTPPLPCNEAERARIARLLADRPIWAAASTHPGEEDMIADAHVTAARAVMRLLCILVPRHPSRGDEIADALRTRGLSVSQRARGEDPGPNTAIFLADTLGELGLWYRLAPVSFVGGSLVPLGGHNPYEPAALGSAILHGPHVANFADIYRKLDEADAACQVPDTAGLAEALVQLSEPQNRAPMAYAAWEIGSASADVTNRALRLIRDTLPAKGAR